MPLELPDNYRYAAVACGVRPDRERLDLALVVSDRPASAAGVFTQNRVAAAPVCVSRERVPTQSARGFVVCAGNANACTGEQGMSDASAMAARAATAIGCDQHEMLVASTGVIGRLLPMENTARGIDAAGRKLAPGVNAFEDVTRAILTTDTRPKVAGAALELAGQKVRIIGFAKGAAMIGPNLATMLGFVLTDAAVSPSALHDVLTVAADRSFNCVSVEGHTSTNDSVFLFANGNGQQLTGMQLGRFATSVESVCGQLAEMIADDAEGATHLVLLDVRGLANDADARRVAKAIADSPLVKTAIFGGDPNWGRIVSAAGYAGVQFAEAEVSLWLGDTLLYDRGLPVPFDESLATKYLKENRRIEVKLVCGNGPGKCLFRTCDLTPEYVRLNAEYTT